MGAIVEMWVPCVAFAHAFAAFWLVQTLLVMNPSLPHDIKQWLKRCSRGVKGEKSAGKEAAATQPKDVTSTDQAATQQPLISRKVSQNPAAAAMVPKESVLLLRRLTTMMQSITLEWSNVGCSYSTGQGVKTVLQGVTGRVRPSEMLALMGPSGAGKSTLMDIVAGRKTVGMLTGSVTANGRPRGKDFTRKTAYVPQEDNFIPTMTVSETLAFYSSLVLPKRWSRAQRAERVEEVQRAMGMAHASNTMVGGHLPGGLVVRGLSGGERKRLSIAAGIMPTPCIVFLDEPTSGLDSFAALSVMTFMRAMADGGHAVVSSIHQPRAAIWNMFDTTLIVSGGLEVYFGPVTGVVPWFRDELGYSYDPAMHGVPSDWVIDLVNVGFYKPERFYGHMMNSRGELEDAAQRFKKALESQEEQLKAEQGGVGSQGWPIVEPLAAPDSPQQQHRAVTWTKVPVKDAASAQQEQQEQAAGAAGAAGALPGMTGTAGAARAAGPAAGPTPAAGAAEPAGEIDIEQGRPVGTGAHAGTPGHAIGRLRTCTPAQQQQQQQLQQQQQQQQQQQEQQGQQAQQRSPAAPAPAAAFVPAPSPASSHDHPDPPQAGAAAATAAAATAAGAAGTATRPGAGANGLSGSGGRVDDAEKGLSAGRHDNADKGLSAGRQDTPPMSPEDAARLQGLVEEHTLRAASTEAGRGDGFSSGDGKKGTPSNRAAWTTQFRVLLTREFKAVTRNPADVAGRMLIFSWCSIFIGLIFYDLPETMSSLRSRLSLMFIQPTLFLLLPYVYMSLYTADKQFYIADASSKLYATSAYYTAKVVAILPFSILNCLVFSLTLYGMAGLRHDAYAVVQNVIISTLVYLIASQVLYFAAVVMPNQDAAFMLAIGWTAINLLLSNFMIRYNTMRQVWLSKLRYISAEGYAFNGLVRAEFYGVNMSCAEGLDERTILALPDFLPNTTQVANPGVLNLLRHPGNCTLDLTTVLNFFDVTLVFWQTAVILVGYLIFMHLLTYGGFRFIGAKEKR